MVYSLGRSVSIYDNNNFKQVYKTWHDFEFQKWLNMVGTCKN